MRLSCKTVSLVFALSLLAACTPAGTDITVNQQQAPGDHPEVDREADGTVSNVGVGATLPKDWPTDVPVYPGATIQYAVSLNQSSDKRGYFLTLETTDTVQQVMDYYSKQLASNQWTVNGTMSTGGTSALAAMKGEFALSVTASVADGKTSITVGVGEEH